MPDQARRREAEAWGYSIGSRQIVGGSARLRAGLRPMEPCRAVSSRTGPTIFSLDRGGYFDRIARGQ